MTCNYGAERLLSYLKVAISTVSVLYPISIYFFGNYQVYLLLIMSILWGGRSCLEFLSNDITKNDWGKFSLLLSIFFICCLIMRKFHMQYFYPVFINFFLFISFYLSLSNIPIITRFAMIKDKNLSDIAKKYTRNLTKVWIIFFIINGLISFILALFDSKFYWFIYCGLVSYILIGILLLGEIVFRKLYVKNV